jgi:hypothetical protein
MPNDTEQKLDRLLNMVEATQKTQARMQLQIAAGANADQLTSKPAKNQDKRLRRILAATAEAVAEADDLEDEDGGVEDVRKALAKGACLSRLPLPPPFVVPRPSFFLHGFKLKCLCGRRTPSYPASATQRLRAAVFAFWRAEHRLFAPPGPGSDGRRAKLFSLFIIFYFHVHIYVEIESTEWVHHSIGKGVGGARAESPCVCDTNASGWSRGRAEARVAKPQGSFSK